MLFPDQWTTQTRPPDPDCNMKRKRRVKRPKSTDIDQHKDDAVDSENVHSTESKRRCMESVDGTTTTSPIHDTVDCISMSVSGYASRIPDSLLAMKPGETNSHGNPIPKDSATLSTETPFRPVAVPSVIDASDTEKPPLVLEIHSLISRLPYQQMLNQVFTDDASSACSVPVVTRAYEESFMREPIYPHERKCVCGDNCEFNFIDPQMPFTGVEFTLNKDVEGDGQVETIPQMCVLCSRRLTQELFYNMVYNGQRFRGVIQRYGNLCQQPGEYAREALLICPQNGFTHNMPLPIVAHHRHRYSVYSQNGTRYVRQHKVKFEDFQCPSSSTLSHQH
jgi:hypothetical protein